MANRVYVVESKTHSSHKWLPRWSSVVARSSYERCRSFTVMYPKYRWRVVPYEFTGKRALLAFERAKVTK